MLKNLFNGLAAADLGLGVQSSDADTEEQRRKKLELKQMQAQTGMSPGLASRELLGGFTGRGGFGALAF